MSNITTEQTYNSLFLEGILQGSKFQVTTQTDVGSGGQKKYGIKTGDRKCLLGLQVTSKGLMRTFFNINATYNAGSTTFTTRTTNDTADMTSDVVIKTGLSGGVFNGNTAYTTQSNSFQPGFIGNNQGCLVEAFILDANSTSMFLIKKFRRIRFFYSFLLFF